MKVALDLEDVLVESNRIFIEELQRFVEREHPEANCEFQVSQIRGFKFMGVRDRFAEIRGWETQIEKKFMNGDGNGWKGFYPITERIWRNEPFRFPPLNGNASEELEMMKRQLPDYSEVHLVTGRENVRGGIKRRLEQLGILDELDGFKVEKRKESLDYDIYIDDHPCLHRRLDSGIQLMVDQPWNRNKDLDDPHMRVKNLAEAVETVKSGEIDVD